MDTTRQIVREAASPRVLALTAHEDRDPVISVLEAGAIGCLPKTVGLGELLAAHARPGLLGEDGLADLRQAHPLLHLGRNRFTTAAAETYEPSLDG